jgi:MYXO-CTERM domain-containing protein
MGVWFGNAWDERIERDGWVFVRSGNAYAAVRPVTWDEEYERSLPSTGIGNQINFTMWVSTPNLQNRICEFRVLTDAAIPAPGAMALLGIAGALGGRRRR